MSSARGRDLSPLAGAFQSVFSRFLTISGRFFTRSDFASIYQLLQIGHNQLQILQTVRI